MQGSSDSQSSIQHHSYCFFEPMWEVLTGAQARNPFFYFVKTRENIGQAFTAAGAGTDFEQATHELLHMAGHVWRIRI